MRRTCVVAPMVLAAIAVQFAVYAEDFTLQRDVIYGHKAGMALTMDIIRPAQPNGAGLINVVSGGWVSRYFDLDKAMADSAQSGGRLTTLVGKGYTVFTVRHGSSPYFKVPDAVADMRRAVRFIRHNAREFGIDPNRIGVFGASAGGHLSLMLGTTSDSGGASGTDDASPKDDVDQESERVQAVVAYYPPVDLRQFVGPSERYPALDFDRSLADGVSPILFVTKDDAPTLLVHGDQDTTVPIDHSVRMQAALKDAGVPVDFITIPGAGHGFRGDDAHTAATALANWFDKYLLTGRE